MSHLSESQNERLREAAWIWVRDKGSKAALARELGLSEAAVGKILNRRGGASYETAERFAKLVGKSRDELVGPRGEERPAVRRVVVEIEEHYPTRAAVIARNAGRWSESAIAAVRSYALDSDDDPGEAFWTHALNTFEHATKGIDLLRPAIEVDPNDL